MDGLHRWLSDAETVRYLGDGTVADRTGAWRALAEILGHWELRGYGLWAVEDRSTGELLGRVGLYNPEGWPGLEVGWLIDRSRWGEGFAAEAGRVSLEYAFREMNAPDVISVIHPANAASIRVAEKLGGRHQRDMRLGEIDVAIFGYSRRGC